MTVTYSKFKVFKSKAKGGRDSQQDDYYVEYNESLDKLIMVVADGMGGHKGGEIASEITVKKTKQFFQDKRNENLSAHEFFKKLIPSIHESILKRGLKDNISPHTTIVIAIVQNGYIEYAHIGDSRLYIFTEEEQLVERTRDHSVPEMLFQMGEISEDEMATHPDQNKLTKSLGGERAESFTFKQHKIDTSKNYAIVLCSDGLWEYFTDAQMNYALFQSKLALNDIGNTMIDKAISVGGQNGDNITLVFTFISASEKKNILNKILKSSWIEIAIGIIILLSVGTYFLLDYSSNKAQNSPPPPSTEKKSGDNNELSKNFPKNKNSVVPIKDENLTKKRLGDNNEPSKTSPKNKNLKKWIIEVEKIEKIIEDKERASQYKKLFEKNKTKFKQLIQKKDDLIILNDYEETLKKAVDSYKKKEYNTTETHYLNCFTHIKG